jgi:hypothetical protein
MRRRSALPLLAIPWLIGLLGYALLRWGRGIASPVAALGLVTAAFVAFVALLGPLARTWLRPRCGTCG